MNKIFSHRTLQNFTKQAQTHGVNKYVQFGLIMLCIAGEVFIYPIRNMTQRFRSWWQNQNSLPSLLKSRNFTQVDLHEWLVEATMIRSLHIRENRRFRRAPGIIILFCSFIILTTPIYLLPSSILITISSILSFILLILFLIPRTNLKHNYRHIILHFSIVIFIGYCYGVFWDYFLQDSIIENKHLVRTTAVLAIMLFIYTVSLLFVSDFYFKIKKLLKGYLIFWPSSGDQLRRVRTVEHVTAWLVVIAPQNTKNELKNGLDKGYVRDLYEIAKESQDRPDWINNVFAFGTIIVAILIAYDTPIVTNIIENLFVPVASYVTTYLEDMRLETTNWFILGSVVAFCCTALVFSFLGAIIDIFPFITDSYPTIIANRLVKTAYRQVILLYEQGYTPEEALKKLNYTYEIVDDPKAKAPKGYQIEGSCPALESNQPQWYRLLRKIDEPYDINNPW